VPSLRFLVIGVMGGLGGGTSGGAARRSRSAAARRSPRATDEAEARP